jgi:hypothetical protein
MTLIYIGPDGAKFPLTPDQYAALIAKLSSDPDVSGLVNHEGEAPGLDLVAGKLAGGCTYQKITFSWAYDGVGELTVAILEDHNWKAKLAGNEAIFGELKAKLLDPVTAPQT